MMTSIVEAEAILAIDIGETQTRAILIDEAGGQYHFVSAGSAQSTFQAPFANIFLGVQDALVSLQQISGRNFLDIDSKLLIPSRGDGNGADKLVVTFSAGPELKVVTMGLLGDVSLESANRLAHSFSSRIMETIGLSDNRRLESQFDAILKASPNLIILAGGTDGGASRSVLRLVELVALVCRLLPRGRQPEVLYVGNRELSAHVKDGLERFTSVHEAPNIHPVLDQENLVPASEQLAQVIGQLRQRQMGGMKDLASSSSIPPVPSSQAFGRIVRYLSRMYDPAKGVLAVDVGASSSIFSAGREGTLALEDIPMGLGGGLPRFLEECKLEDISRWIPFPMALDEINDYLWQKSLYPSALPVTPEVLAIEQAVVRQILLLGMSSLRARYPELPEAFEPILAGGGAITHAPNASQALLMLLDGLQPLGITTLILDRYGLIGALGAVAQINPILPVHVIDSSAFVNLATVICPVSESRPGTPILKVALDYGNGQVIKQDVRQGALVRLPLKPEQTASIRLTPLRKVEIDPRTQVSGFKVTGGICGLVIDARGRPIGLSADPARRTEQFRRWRKVFESQNGTDIASTE